MILIEKIRKVFRLIYFKVSKLRLQLRKKPQIGLDRKVPVIALGTHYGGWKVPEGYLDKKSICYFAGAGIDISFDVDSHFNVTFLNEQVYDRLYPKGHYNV